MPLLFCFFFKKNRIACLSFSFCSPCCFFCQVLCASFLLRAYWDCREDSVKWCHLGPEGVWSVFRPRACYSYPHASEKQWTLMLHNLLPLCKPFLLELTSWTLCMLKCLIKVLYNQLDLLETGLLDFDTALKLCSTK